MNKNLKYKYPIEIEILNNAIPLDKECWCCNKGQTTPKENFFLDNNGACTECKGKGFILTEEGKAIMNLIKRHGGQNE